MDWVIAINISIIKVLDMNIDNVKIIETQP